jgi:hypothetical protein
VSKKEKKLQKKTVFVPCSLLLASYSRDRKNPERRSRKYSGLDGLVQEGRLITARRLREAEDRARRA